MDNVLYFHINPIKQEIFNVGIGGPKRPYSKQSRSKLWHNIVNKYGYDIVIVHNNLTRKEAQELEIKYISQIGRRDKGEGSLVNFTDGGDGGYNLSQETRNKISVSKKNVSLSEKHRNSISKSLIGNKRTLGHKHTKEAKEKISIARKGKSSWNKGVKISLETKYKISQTSKKNWRNQYSRPLL